MNDTRATSRRAAALKALLVVQGLLPIACQDPPLEVVDREPAGGTDVTFFVAADTHFGHQGIAALNKRQIETMNRLPGTAYPRQIGGTVARPLGVLIAGDLTEYGRGAQWDQFVEHYGLTGGDGLLKYPVYEGTGNHDRDIPVYRPALRDVKKRHGGLAYSWDWEDLHLVCLDIYPTAANLRWLKRDLARVGRKLPVVVYFHYPLLGPYSDPWSDKEKEAFRKTIDGFNVIAIFHGHYHGSGHYTWGGYDVYNVGSPRHGDHSFAAARVTDTRMTVALWDWDRDRWRWGHVKRIRGVSVRPAASAPAGR